MNTLANIWRMRIKKYCAWMLAAIYLIIGVLYFIPNAYVGSHAKYDINFPMAVFYIVTACWYAFAVFIVRKYERVLEIAGVLYVLLAVDGFVFVPKEGNILMFFHANYVASWTHLLLGSIAFFTAWITYEMKIRKLRKAEHDGQVLHL